MKKPDEEISVNKAIQKVEGLVKETEVILENLNESYIFF